MAYTYGNTQNAAERIKEISGVNPLKCMKCGKCSATCPAFNEMDIKPHQFVSYVINENIEALVNSASLWKCLSCFACVERCPRDVKPGKIIDGARQLVVREKGGKSISLHAQCRVRAFYEKLGFCGYGVEDEDEGCPHCWMKKQLSL